MFEQKSAKETILELHSSAHNGLSETEARKRLEQNGKNELKEGKKKSVAEAFFEQLNDPLIYVLLVAVIISLLLHEISDAMIILVVVTVNAVVGVIQEGKAQKALEALKGLTIPKAIVKREGRKREVLSSELVVGDIVYLDAGRQIPADLRLLETVSMKVEESALTGESLPVEKDALFQANQTCPVGDRKNMAYMSTVVTYGRGTGIVTAVGMDTEIGKIAAMIDEAPQELTPLQKRLGDLGKLLSIVAVVLCAALFAIAVIQKRDIADMLITAISLAVAAVPEGLPAVLTIVLALSVSKMVKVHTIVRKLPSVETLGAVGVVCSDKTGTLTQNKMTVQNIYTNGQTITIDQLNLKNQLHRYLLYDAILTNDSSIVDGKGIGDPTEFALVEMGRKATVDENLLRELMPRLEEIPFDSDRKLMSTKYELHDVPTVLTKGALDVLLDRTVKIRMEEGIRDITREDREAILQKNLEFSQEGLRVLAFGYKEVPQDYILSLDNEKDFIFLGLISMMDPPREESKAAVADAKRAGIKPVMITGDHKITATAIAKQIGIYEDGDMAMTGRELDAMPEEELDRKITDISVYARVSPENKIRIVDAWQRRGSITAMTGDGVNDAPALKKADIGVAMGITGTEVSKDAAAMILTDDNFATIIKAVANGRNVYRNIKNAIKFLLSGNMAGILSVLYTSLAALPVPFAPVHLLFINLLTDSLPAIAIGMEPAEKDLLSEAPRNPKTGILTKDFMTTILTQGGIIAVCTMIAFHAGLRTGSAATASTMAFATLTLARLFHGFNCRSKHNIFKLGFSSNWYSLGAFAAGVVLLGIVMFVPFMQNLFSVTPLTQSQIVNVCILAAVPTVLIQLFKIIRDIKHRK